MIELDRSCVNFETKNKNRKILNKLRKMFSSRGFIFAVLLVGFVLVANVRCAPESVSFYFF